jgi:undecaprenyl-diphosphatase
MLKFILLGCIQGFTEFLPVSSSAHLALAQHFLGMRDSELAITIIFHLGTLVALLFFFYEDILRLLRNKTLLKLVLIVTLITGVVGIVGKDFIEGLFSSPRYVAVALCITGVILLLTRKFMESSRATLFTSDAVVFGIAQALSISPGISRSGMTIAALLFKGVNRQTAFRFSFLAAIPAIAGAALLEIKDIQHSRFMQDHFWELIVGFIVSFITGMVALKMLRWIMQKAHFHYFGYYCLLAGITSFILISRGW